MRAIVLSAGQGRRLLPLTTSDPKCLLSVDGDRSVLELQLRALARCGVEHASVLVGFGAERVERFVAETAIPGLKAETVYNPFYATSDNLVTCWLARPAMNEDFVLLNGDTLFEDEVLRRLLHSPAAPVTVTIDRKAAYDDDDMKVSLDGTRLTAIGKQLPEDQVDGESIGMLLFRSAGGAAFGAALDRAVRAQESMNRWYLSVIHEMARDTTVQTASIEGLWWREIDSPEDLSDVRSFFLHAAADQKDEVPFHAIAGK